MLAGDEIHGDEVTSGKALDEYIKTRRCYLCGETPSPENPIVWVPIAEQWLCSLCEEEL